MNLSRRLLDRAAPEPRFRAALEGEARDLTDIGNDFRIRHHETSKIEIGNSDQVDHLFHRLFALIWLLLKSL